MRLSRLSRTTLLRAILPKNDWGDALYATLYHLIRLGRWPRGRNPRRFNDYLYRLKVDGSLQDPLCVFTTDKEYAKYFIASVVGWEHTIETYRVLRTKAEVDGLVLDRFPCVVKPTHMSGPAQVHPDADSPLRRDLLREWFEADFYHETREQNYRPLASKVIIEEFVSEDGRTIPEDYKVFCFGGVPKIVQVDQGRFSGHTRSLYDTSWNKLPIKLHYPDVSRPCPRPVMLEKMLHVAERLARQFAFVRVDMYAVNGRVKVGELTHCSESAVGKIRPPSGEITLGRFFEPDAPARTDGGEKKRR